MAIIRAFRGIRPQPAYAPQVAALPYDVMTTDEAREMVKGNPYSFLHVDKSEIDLEPGIDIYDPQVYAKAKENLNAMIRDAILVQDTEPALYIYRLTMNGRSQTGLVACTAIDEYLNGLIKKHELTRQDKEQDRINHVNITNANTGPIFLAYRAQEQINGILHKWTAEKKPACDFTADDGISHTVWVIDDKAVMEQLTAQFAAVPALYIADGHHRNASAVKVGLERREKSAVNDPNAEYNFYLSVIFPDDELYIMDYNRAVKDLNGLSKEEFLEKIADKFTVTAVDGKATKPDNIHQFGMYLHKQWYTLNARESILSGDPISSLDVSLLQNELLAPILAIGDPRTDKRIDFIGGMRGLAELEKRVDSGEMAVAFALFPTSMGELMQIADDGKIMPPKSTWFEPKLRSGLFIHSLE